MPKFNFIQNRKKLSDKEIESNMNFDKFMQGYQAGDSGILSIIKSFKLLAGMAAVAAITGTFYLVKKITDDNSKEAFIKPPLEEVRIQPHNYSISNVRDTIITYKTGSSVYIPASAFIDENGKDISGNIEIRYREFHSAFDIFLSGIPMDYDSAGLSFQLETAGMLECLAFKDDKPLYLKPGKEITVNMVSRTTDDDHNIYYLDTIKRNWQYISENTKANKTNIPIYDNQVVKNYEAEINNNIEPAVPSFAQSTLPNIELDYDKEEFPELAVFDGIKFEIDPSNKNFDPRLANKTWEDVSVSKDVQARKYRLTFTQGDETHDFIVTPVLEGKNYEKAQEEYIKKQEEYFVLLEKKKQDEKYREEVMQSNYDKLMNAARWSNVNQRINDFISRDIVNYGELAARTLRIRSLGIWNCDRPIIQYMEDAGTGNGEIITRGAFFTDEKGNILDVRTVYVIPSERQTLYGFPTKGNKVDKFSYAANADYTLLAVTVDGYPAYVSEGGFKKMTAGSGDINFKLTVADKKFRDEESLKAFLKM